MAEPLKLSGGEQRADLRQRPPCASAPCDYHQMQPLDGWTRCRSIPQEPAVGYDAGPPPVVPPGYGRPSCDSCGATPAQWCRPECPVARLAADIVARREVRSAD